MRDYDVDADLRDWMDSKNKLELWREKQSQVQEALEGYCDYCEVSGHTFRTCPRRDDESLYLEGDEEVFEMDEQERDRIWEVE